MKTLTAALLMAFSALLVSDEYPDNRNPKVGEKGRLTSTVFKVIDSNTVHVLADGKVFIVKGENDMFKDSVNGEKITFAYVRTGTEIIGTKVCSLKFVKEYSKEDLEKERKDKEIEEHKAKETPEKETPEKEPAEKKTPENNGKKEQ